jgi:hypothetical protein
VAKIAKDRALRPGLIRTTRGEAARQFRPAARPMAFSTSGYRRRRVCIGSGLRVLHSLMNHGQLQHGHSLPFREMRYEYIASIWKFDRIMVTMRNIWVYRAEFPNSEIDCSLPNPSVVVFDIFGER